MRSIYHALAELEVKNESAALCTVTKSEGSTPRHMGSKMLVLQDGKFIGTVGGGELENRVIKAALESLNSGRAQTLTYSMADPTRGDPGVCGGQVEVFVEPIFPPRTLAVIGAGHVGKAVVHLAKWLGFYVVVCDDRAELCNPAVIPNADAYYPISMDQLPEQITIDHRTILILTTRSSGVDVAGMGPLLDSAAAYIGVIGSRRRWATTVTALKEKGVTDAKIARVHSPMGLELEAETPEEIAVSILAEVLMIKDKGTGTSMNV